MKSKAEISAAVSCILSCILMGVGVARGWDPAVTMGSLVIAEINWAVAVILSELRGGS